MDLIRPLRALKGPFEPLRAFGQLAFQRPVKALSKAFQKSFERLLKGIVKALQRPLQAFKRPFIESPEKVF